MSNNLKDRFYKATYASFFAIITIGFLSILSIKTDIGWFLAGSFGATMVLIYGYPQSDFAQPLNIFFGHIITSLSGLIVLYFIPLPTFFLIPLAVGCGIFLMIVLDVVHPPAGGNGIVIILGNMSFDFLLFPIITGAVLIVVLAIVVNRFILKIEYPIDKNKSTQKSFL